MTGLIDWVRQLFKRRHVCELCGRPVYAITEDERARALAAFRDKHLGTGCVYMPLGPPLWCDDCYREFCDANEDLFGPITG